MDDLGSGLVGVVAVLGAGFAFALVIAALTVADLLRPGTGPDRLDRRVRLSVSRGTLVRAGTAVAAAALVGALTRWPVGALLAGIGAYALPSIVGGDRSQRQALARTEAVAAWAEMLRDNLATAAGLEQTIIVTAPFAPAAIAEDIADVAAALRSGVPLPAALAELRTRLDDPTGQLIVKALQQAAQRQSRQLAELLSELARRARERAMLRLRIAPGQAKIRTNARMVVGFTIAMAVGLVVFDRPFLAPYNSPAGQGVLLVIGAIFAAGFAGITSLARTGLDDTATRRQQRPGTSGLRGDRAAAYRSTSPYRGRAGTTPIDQVPADDAGGWWR